MLRGVAVRTQMTVRWFENGLPLINKSSKGRKKDENESMLLSEREIEIEIEREIL